MSKKIVIFLSVVLLWSCSDNSVNNNPIEEPPFEKEEMFSFLKIGNSWTYQYVGSPSSLVTITIDSIEFISENESIYLGTYLEWVSYPWQQDTFIYETNVQLFHLKDSVLTVNVGYYTVQFDYNWSDGQVIYSLDGKNKDGQQEWFPVTVSKGIYHNNTGMMWDDVPGENFIYTDCIMFEGWWSQSIQGSPSGGIGEGIRTVLSNKYGLIYYSYFIQDPIWASGFNRELLNRNFE